LGEATAREESTDWTKDLTLMRGEEKRKGVLLLIGVAALGICVELLVGVAERSGKRLSDGLTLTGRGEGRGATLGVEDEAVGLSIGLIKV
jgi:hypothetical protein